MVFVFNMMLTLSTEKNEFTLNSALLVLLMLFTYAKLWVFVVLKALWLSFEDQVFHKEVKWDKTVRYEEETETSEEEAALQEELLHKKGR